MTRILVCNDDGHQAEGLRALVEAMEGLGEVWVVAPESEQSAASHAISLYRPLRIREVRARWYAVDGTPTDCSYVGVNHIMKGGRPDLMVSGINRGPNMADDASYSGTVAAAMEASLLGIPAIAFSLATRRDFDFGPAGRFARKLVAAALTQQLSPHMLLNVNVPAGPDPEGYVITRLGKHSYGAEVIEKVIFFEIFALGAISLFQLTGSTTLRDLAVLALILGTVSCYVALGGEWWRGGFTFIY